MISLSSSPAGEITREELGERTPREVALEAANRALLVARNMSPKDIIRLLSSIPSDDSIQQGFGNVPFERVSLDPIEFARYERMIIGDGRRLSKAAR